MHSRNFDFAPLRDDPSRAIYTGCIVRRFCAAFVDVALVLLLMILLAVLFDEDPDPDRISVHGWPAAVGLVLPLALLYGMEYLYRQTPGMALFGVILLAPMDRPAWYSLLVRKLLQLMEAALFFGWIYYFFTALSDDCASLSDRTSGCRIVRRKFLLAPPEAPKKMPLLPVRLLVACFFSALPVILMIALFLGGVWTLLKVLEWGPPPAP